MFLFVSYNKNKVNGFGLCLQWIFHQIQLGSYQRALPVPGILKLCNYLQNVVAITYIFGLQLSTFLFYNKQPKMKKEIKKQESKIKKETNASKKQKLNEEIIDMKKMFEDIFGEIYVGESD